MHQGSVQRALGTSCSCRDRDSPAHHGAAHRPSPVGVPGAVLGRSCCWSWAGWAGCCQAHHTSKLCFTAMRINPVNWNIKPSGGAITHAQVWAQYPSFEWCCLTDWVVLIVHVLSYKTLKERSDFNHSELQWSCATSSYIILESSSLWTCGSLN